LQKFLQRGLSEGIYLCFFASANQKGKKGKSLSLFLFPIFQNYFSQTSIMNPTPARNGGGGRERKKTLFSTFFVPSIFCVPNLFGVTNPNPLV
jgi:hypothetical protein